MSSMLRAAFRAASLTHCKDFLKITWQDGVVSQFPNLWLRSSVRDPNIFDANTFIYQQKDFARFVTKESPIVDAEYKDGSEDILVYWDDHQTAFNASWLRARDSINSEQLKPDPNLTTWDAQTKMFTYDFADRTEKLSSWMSDLRKYGIAFFKGVPPNAQGLQELLETIGQRMQRTHPLDYLTVNVDQGHIEDLDVHVYGPDLHPMHCDTAYYAVPARLSGLLCSKYSAPVSDTENSFVDSLNVIEEIRREEPEAFELLSTYPVRLSRRRMNVQEACEPEKVGIYNFENLLKAPLISYDRNEERLALRFTQKHCGVDMESFKDQATMKRFYEAFLLLDNKLHDPKNHQSLVLKEGWCALVNNYRVCHGRGPFHPSTKRTLLVSFLSDAVWRARWRVLHGEKSGVDPKWLYGCSEQELEILANRFMDH